MHVVFLLARDFHAENSACELCIGFWVDDVRYRTRRSTRNPIPYLEKRTSWNGMPKIIEEEFVGFSEARNPNLSG
jgi:hypothetical protein